MKPELSRGCVKFGEVVANIDVNNAKLHPDSQNPMISSGIRQL